MANHHPTPARLEAFSDGVIAVIITIMVLELKVPAQNGLAGLYAIIPTLLVYLLSFAMTGIYWINHHHLVHRLKHVDDLILYANLAFLFSLSLLPFFTNYLLEKHIDTFSVLLYVGSMIATGMTFGLLRFGVNRVLCLEGELAVVDIATQRKHIFSLMIYVVAIPLAFRYPRLALVDISLVTLLWVVPTFGVKLQPAMEQEAR